MNKINFVLKKQFGCLDGNKYMMFLRKQELKEKFSVS